MLQLTELFPKFDALHLKFGDTASPAIYGGGCLKAPEICLIFMNPTARNISVKPDWKGLRAPWLGTKQIWNLINGIGAFKNKELFTQTQTLKPAGWYEQLAEQIYLEMANSSVYITNLAKCTQADARPLPDKVFRAYRDLMLTELEMIKPKLVFTFGNQVSSILLQKPVSVSRYTGLEFELLHVGNRNYKVFPVYYPVGQGTRNQPKAIERINLVKGSTN